MSNYQRVSYMIPMKRIGASPRYPTDRVIAMRIPLQAKVESTLGERFLDGWSCSPTEWTGDHPSSYMYIECIYTYIYIYIYKNVEIRYLIIAAYVIYIYIYIIYIYISSILINICIYIYIFIDILLYQCIISAASLLHVRLGCDWVAATETDLAADATALGSEGFGRMVCDLVAFSMDLDYIFPWYLR